MLKLAQKLTWPVTQWMKHKVRIQSQVQRLDSRLKLSRHDAQSNKQADAILEE